MTRRLLALGSALACLALTSAAAATETVVSARAQITGSGGSYRLTVTNDRDRPILCFGLLLTGVQPTSATGPSGVLTRVGSSREGGSCTCRGTPRHRSSRPEGP